MTAPLASFTKRNSPGNDTNGTFDAHVHQFAVDAAPFGSFEALVAQQYQDFVGRAPTSVESAEWRARLVHGEQSPDSALVAFARSSAFAAKRAPLIRLYWAFFLRVPDQGGLDDWTGKLAKGSSLAAVAKQFSASSEFQSKYGSKTNAQFVTLIYQNIFQRDPDAAGLAYWTKKLDTKQKTRGDVMVNFSESSEGVRRLAPQADTVLLHLGMFGSMPSKDTLTGWIAQQGLGGVPSDIAHSFRGQAAYASRITP